MEGIEAPRIEPMWSHSQYQDEILRYHFQPCSAPETCGLLCYFVEIVASVFFVEQRRHVWERDSGSPLLQFRCIAYLLADKILF